MVKLMQFKGRVSDPLEDVLQRGETIVRNLEQIRCKPNFPHDLENELIEQNQELMDCMAEIHDRLINADESRFATDIDWLDLYDPFEDKIMQLMNGALDKNKDLAIRDDGIRRCRSAFRQFKKSITEKIETQVANLAC